MGRHLMVSLMRHPQQGLNYVNVRDEGLDLTVHGETITVSIDERLPDIFDEASAVTLRGQRPRRDDVFVVTVTAEDMRTHVLGVCASDTAAKQVVVDHQEDTQGCYEPGAYGIMPQTLVDYRPQGPPPPPSNEQIEKLREQLMDDCRTYSNAQVPWRLDKDKLHRLLADAGMLFLKSPRIACIVEGGCLRDVYSDTPGIEVELVDHDSDDSEASGKAEARGEQILSEYPHRVF